MSDLTAFLLARIAEDEEVARAVGPINVTRLPNGEEWPDVLTHERLVTEGIEGRTVRRRDPQAEVHYSRHDPARVLAECEARRRIVELHHTVDIFPWSPNGACDECSDSGWEVGVDSAQPVDAPCQTLRLLALPYADHPDYQQEWTP